MSSHWKLTVLVWTEVYVKLKKKILSPAPSWNIRWHWDAEKQIAGPVHCREDRAQKRGDEHIACIDMLMHNERKFQRPGRSPQIWQVWEDNYCSITAWYGTRHWALADPINPSSMKEGQIQNSVGCSHISVSDMGQKGSRNTPRKWFSWWKKCLRRRNGVYPIWHWCRS